MGVAITKARVAPEAKCPWCVACAYTEISENVLAFPQECSYFTAGIICWPINKVSLSSANKYSYSHREK